MERERIKNKLENNLQKYNMMSLGSFKNTVVEQLINIEQYLTQSEEKIDSAVETLNSINLTVRGISKESGVSKSTVYNSQDILKPYVEQRIEEINKKDTFSKEKVQKLQNQVSELQSLIDKTTIDIISYENLYYNNSELKKKVATLNEKVELMNEERQQFIRKLNEMEIELRKYRNKGKVIPIEK